MIQNMSKPRRASIESSRGDEAEVDVDPSAGVVAIIGMAPRNKTGTQTASRPAFFTRRGIFPRGNKVDSSFPAGDRASAHYRGFW